MAASNYTLLWKLLLLLQTPLVSQLFFLCADQSVLILIGLH
jgi:hypothetical protein